MTAITPPVVDAGRSQSTKFSGYLVAIVVNVILLFVANNLLAWDLLPFLTDEFGEVLWIIDVSLLATIVVNAIFLGYDPDWFKSVCKIGLGVISIALATRMYQVFPFDFSAYDSNWIPITRFVMVLVIVGTGIGVVVEMTKLARALVLNSERGPQ